MENGTPTHTPSLAQQQQQQNNDSDGGNNSGDPSGFLGEIVNSPVTVKLNSGVVYRGELQSVDGYMNIALEQTREIVEGSGAGGAGGGRERVRRNYGDAFIRGNNVMYISADS